MSTYFSIPYRKSLKTFIRRIRGITTKSRGREAPRSFLHHFLRATSSLSAFVVKKTMLIFSSSPICHEFLPACKSTSVHRHEGTKGFYFSISNNAAAFSHRIARLSSMERYSASLIVVTDRPITSGQAICSVPKRILSLPAVATASLSNRLKS